MTDVEWDNDEAADLETAARFEQYQLWDDLAQAIRNAIHTDWSMQCENIANRIAMLARLTGPVPWTHVQIPQLRSGVYEKVLRSASIEYEPIDWHQVEQAEQGLTLRPR